MFAMRIIVIDWENAKVVDRESDKAGRLIREAIWIRKTDNRAPQPIGRYSLSIPLRVGGCVGLGLAQSVM